MAKYERDDWLSSYLSKHDPTKSSGQPAPVISKAKTGKAGVRKSLSDKRRSWTKRDEASSAAVHPSTANAATTSTANVHSKPTTAPTAAQVSKAREAAAKAQSGRPSEAPRVPDGFQSVGRRSSLSNHRRVSLDYTKLDAVKERVMSATTLWSVVDDEDEGTDSGTVPETPNSTFSSCTGAMSAAPAVVPPQPASAVVSLQQQQKQVAPLTSAFPGHQRVPSSNFEEQGDKEKAGSSSSSGKTSSFLKKFGLKK